MPFVCCPIFLLKWWWSRDGAYRRGQQTPPFTLLHPTLSSSRLTRASDSPIAPIYREDKVVGLRPMREITMSQPTPDKTHLWEDDLTEGADKERKSFAEWASSVSFKQQAEDFEIYDSNDLSTRVEPFLRELGLLGKVDCFLKVREQG